MKNLIRVGLPLIAAIVLLVPGAVGLLAQPHLMAITEQLGEQVADYATEIASEHRRGWFRSTYRAQFAVHDRQLGDSLLLLTGLPASATGPLLDATAVLYHGPLPLTSPRRGGLMPAAGTVGITLHVVSGDERVPLPATASARLGLGGPRARIHLQAVDNLQLDAASALSFAGGTLDVSANHALSAVDGRADLGPVSITETTSGEIALDISAVELAASGTTLDGRTRGQLALDVGNTILTGHTSGGARVDMSFDVDQAAFRALLDTLGALPADADRAAAAVAADLTALASRGADMRLHEFLLDTRFGAAAGRADASVPAGDSDPVNMLRRATGSAHLEVPVGFARALAGTTPDGDKQLRTAVALGFVKTSGDNYVSDLAYDQGKLEINGFPMPVPF